MQAHQLFYFCQQMQSIYFQITRQIIGIFFLILENSDWLIPQLSSQLAASLFRKRLPKGKYMISFFFSLKNTPLKNYNKVIHTYQENEINLSKGTKIVLISIYFHA